MTFAKFLEGQIEELRNPEAAMLRSDTLKAAQEVLDRVEATKATSVAQALAGTLRLMPGITQEDHFQKLDGLIYRAQCLRDYAASEITNRKRLVLLYRRTINKLNKDS